MWTPTPRGFVEVIFSSANEAHMADWATVIAVGTSTDHFLLLVAALEAEFSGWTLNKTAWTGAGVRSCDD